MIKHLPSELLKATLLYLTAKDINNLSLVDRYCQEQILPLYKSLALFAHYKGKNDNDLHTLFEMAQYYKCAGKHRKLLITVSLLHYLKTIQYPRASSCEANHYVINQQKKLHQTAVNQSILITFPKAEIPSSCSFLSALSTRVDLFAEKIHQNISSFNPLKYYWTITADAHGRVYLFDIITGNRLQSYCHSVLYITSLLYIPERQYVLFAGSEKSIYICDLLSGRLLMVLKGHTQGISCLSYIYRNGQCLLFSGSQDNSIRKWNLSTLYDENASSEPLILTCQDNILYSNSWTIRSSVIHPTESFLYFGDSEGKIRCIDFFTGQSLWQISAHSKNTQCLLIHPITYDLFSAGDDGNIRMWNHQTQQNQGTLAENGSMPTSLAFIYSIEGKITNQLVVTGLRTCIQIWNYETRTLMKTIPSGSTYLQRAIPINEEMIIGNGCTSQIKLFFVD